jgi:hypothetical protein
MDSHHVTFPSPGRFDSSASARSWFEINYLPPEVPAPSAELPILLNILLSDRGAKRICFAAVLNFGDVLIYEVELELQLFQE